MKHLYFLFLLISFSVAAQDITPEVDNQLQLLDKSYITTDILYDRVYPLANLVEFNETANDTSNANHFFQAYYELQKADYSSRWASLNSYKTTIASQEPNIPIGIINVDFEYLDEAAISDNLLDIQGTDSLLVDVSGRSRSPYILKHGLVISALKTYSDSKNVTFELSSSFNLTSSSKSIQSLQADFGDGLGYQTLSLSGQKSISYSNTGIHYIKFKITYTDSSVDYTYSEIEINSSSKITKTSENLSKSRTQTELCYHDVITASRAFQGYDETVSYKGTGEFEVFRGGSLYDKPVIVLDGFDPFEGTSEGVDIQGVYDFLNYNDGVNNVGLDLRGQGYDIVPLNFLKVEAPDGKIINGGTDYIERNAMVLVELIERINNSTCWESNMEPIKIMGFSMGGLVARYALRYMEVNNIPHNTDLYISIDSPHNGAVVPMGVQQMVDFIDDVANIDVADKVLRSPAAKQMLVHHYLSNSNTPAGAPGFHDNFYNSLNSMGFPLQTRNIAVVDGTSKGIAINSSSQRYFDGEIETGAIFPLVGVGADAKMNFSPPGGQTGKVFDFRARLRFLAFYITVYRRYSEVTSSSQFGSHENSPGGYFSVEDEINKFLGPDGRFNTNETLLLEFIAKAKLEISTPEFSFIPLKSSLAYNGGNPYLYDDFSSRNLVCTGETPFDSYYTSVNANQEHIALDSQKANYIYQEILGNQQNPNVQSSLEDINGPDEICSSNVVYNITNCGAPVSNWTVSSNLIIVNQTNTYVTVKSSSTSTSETGFVQANYSAIPNVRKDVYIGKPEFIAPLNSAAPSTEAWADVSGQYTNLWDQGVSQLPTYTVVSSSGYSSIYILDNNDGTYRVRGVGSTNTWNKTINLSIVNGCGTTTKSVYLTPPPPDGGGCTASIQSSDSEVNTYKIINPCGTSTTANYSQNNVYGQEQASTAKMNRYAMKVFDFNGVLLFENNKSSINLNKLDKGYYIIKGYKNDQEMTKKVLKQ